MTYGIAGGGEGGVSFEAATVLGTDAATLEDLAGVNPATALQPTDEDLEILTNNLGISADALSMYDADTVTGLFALAKSMEAVNNGAASADQINILKNADSFLDALYICCTDNGIAGDGTATVGLIDAFKSFVDNLESDIESAGGTLSLGADATLTTTDAEEMLDGFATETEGGSYETDDDDYMPQAESVFGAPLYSPVATSYGYYGAAPAGYGVTTPFGPAEVAGGYGEGVAGAPAGVQAETSGAAAEDEPQAGNQKGDLAVGKNARHDHDGDGLLDHDV